MAKPIIPDQALREPSERDARSGTLFGAHPNSVRVRDGIDLTAPIVKDEIDAERGVLP